MSGRDSVTDQPTVPDLDALWKVFLLVRSDAAHLARWRITHADWQHLRRDQTAHRYGAVQPPRYASDPDEPWTLFGIPVDVIPTERHRWPELVLVSDRRNVGPSPETGV